MLPEHQAVGSRFHWRAIGFVIAYALMSLGSRAHAQAPMPRCSQRLHDDGRQRFERGLEFAQQQRWSDAVREFEAARAACPTPSVYYNLGTTYRMVGRARDGIEAFRRYLETVGPDADSERRAPVVGWVRELSASLARISVRTEPVSATVAIDGVALAPGTAWSDVDPGRHILVIQADGYRAVTRTVDLRPVADVGTRGPPRVRSERRAHRDRVQPPESAIRIDGLVVGNGHSDEVVASGHHVVDVTAPGFSSFHRELDIATSGERRMQVTLVDQPAWPWIVGSAGGAAVAALLIVGGIVLFSTIDPVSREGLPACVGCR